MVRVVAPASNQSSQRLSIACYFFLLAFYFLQIYLSWSVYMPVWFLCDSMWYYWPDKIYYKWNNSIYTDNRMICSLYDNRNSMWTKQFIITYGYLQVLWIYYRYAMVTYDLQLPTGFMGKAQSLLMFHLRSCPIKPVDYNFRLPCHRKSKSRESRSNIFSLDEWLFVWNSHSPNDVQG